MQVETCAVAGIAYITYNLTATNDASGKVTFALTYKDPDSNNSDAAPTVYTYTVSEVKGDAEGHACAHPQPGAFCCPRTHSYPRTYRNPEACCYRNTCPDDAYSADGGHIPAGAADCYSGYQRRRGCPADRGQKAQKVIQAVKKLL